MGTGALSPGVKRQEREADHLPPTSAEVKKMWIYTRESKKLSALLFFQFIYTKVGVEQVRHFST
jgi:hypothetical protein